MTQTISVREAKARLSALIAGAMKGETVTITRNGRPVARLVPVAPKGRRRPGALRGRIHMAPDFDTLPDDMLDLFEGQATDPDEERGDG